MIKVNVKVDVSRMLRETQGEQRKVRLAASRAINRAADTGATTGARTISSKTKLKVREVRTRISVRGSRPDYLIAEIEAHPYSPNLARFRATQNRKGVAASAWERRKVYMHAFIHPRTGKVVTRTTDKRTPLKGLRGPSVPRTFMRDDVLKEIESKVVARFISEFDRDLTRRLSK